MIARYAWLALLLTGPPAGAVYANQRAADSLGRALGRDVARVLAGLPLFPRPTPRAEELQVADRPADAEPRAAAGPPSPKPRQKHQGRKAQSGADQSVFVPAATVLALASRGIVPRGVPVPASDASPAGLRLVGVGTLGLGLRDGDVLTRVLGAPATSVGAVVEAVVGARARNVRIISGEFWREGRSHGLAVEQPYVSSAPLAAPIEGRYAEGEAKLGTVRTPRSP